MNIGDIYVLKALDNYPYYLEETLESLSYALSYEGSNTMALCLMGRIYAEQLKNFEQARNYFLDALTHNVYAIEIYPHYIQLLTDLEEFESAEKTIDFALTLKGINKSEILYKKVLLFEKKLNYKSALKTLKLLNKQIIPVELDVDLSSIRSRLKKKLGKKNTK